MKKIISLFVAICLLAGLMSGCSFKRVSAEEDIINMQVGGYLYTSQVRADTNNERLFLKEREKAISSLLSYMDKATDNSVKLNNGFESYENNLLKYMEKIEDSSKTDSALIMEILEKMTAYKVILESYEDAVISYGEMKSETDGSESIINTYKMDTTSKLIDIQNEYAAWLIENTAIVAAILDKENQRQSGKLISTSASIYTKQVISRLIETMEYYEAAALINSVIISADYYAELIYLDNSAVKIEEMKDGKSKSEISSESIAQLEELLKAAEESLIPPSYLKPLLEKEASFSLFSRVSAAGDTQGNSNGFLEIANTLDSYNKMNITDMDLETMPVKDNGNVEKELEEKKDKIEDEPQIAAKKISTQPEPIVKKSKDADSSSSYFDSAVSYVKDTASSIGDKIRETGETVVEGVKDAGLNFLQGIGLTPDIIIKTAQSYISKNYTSTNSRYAAIIDKMAEHLASGQKIKESGQTAYIMNLINRDLEKMLGDNKDYFVDYILYSNADVLLDTFNVWKDNLADGELHVYTQKDLIDLLALMGIEVKDDIVKEALAETTPSTIPPSSSASPTQTAAQSSPSPSGEPDDEAEPDAPGEYDVFHIMASHDLLRRLDVYADNETLLFNIYGWTDPMDYSALNRSEATDANGNLKQVGYYSDDDAENPVGWYIYIDGNYLLYTYYFPEDKDKELKIKRAGTLDSSFVTNIDTEDETNNRETHIRFKEPGDDDEHEKISYIREEQNGEKDGLYTTSYNSEPTYQTWSEGKLLDSFTYTEGVLTREMYCEYTGDDVYTDTTRYYPDGRLRSKEPELNGDDHGLQVLYSEDGSMLHQIKYSYGIKDGIFEMFFDDGIRWRLRYYKDGKLDGPCEEYYSDAGHPIKFKCNYKDGELDGAYESFTREGIKTSYTEYKNGLKDGVYRKYAYGNTSSSTIHVIGQYSQGKETGEWLYGYNNEGWVEKVFYEDGVKVWDEKIDGKVRTYYNQDGSVSHTEEKP